MRRAGRPEVADARWRKARPLVRGVLDYFPAALAEVAYVSLIGGRQHGTQLAWDRRRSRDHADAAVRHLVERGRLDTDGCRHTAKAAWRILALLQEELEAEGAPPARASVCRRQRRGAGANSSHGRRLL